MKSIFYIEDTLLERKFSTQYEGKLRKKSNQYLPELNPGNNSMISHAESLGSSGLTSSSKFKLSNPKPSKILHHPTKHYRSVSKEYRNSKVYRGSKHGMGGYLNSKNKKYVGK